jgi:lysine 2,3-aminomutase
MKKTLRTAADLVEQELIPAAEAAEIAQVAQKYAIAISPQLQEILHIPGIKQQFVPSVAELNNSELDRPDPIGDQTHSPIKGIIHRYPDRCLLLPVRVCPVFCRFCFRRETVGPGNAALNETELQSCYAYIAQHPEIWEVILSGGDPLILKPQQLENIISNLDKIAHVAIIRIHSRIPMLDSARINAQMLKVLTMRRPIYIVLHINHPAEFTPQAIATINELANSGIVLLGQTVLLKGINDDTNILGSLMRSMVQHRIKPYYLHHTDLTAGTSHFRTTIARGQQLVAALRGSYSGLCQPEYVLDIPGGAGKSPIGQAYIRNQGANYEVTDYNGITHQYCDRS